MRRWQLSPQIFRSFPCLMLLQCSSTPTRFFSEVTLSNKHLLLTSAMVGRGCLYPRPLRLGPFDHNYPLFTNSVFSNRDVSSLGNLPFSDQALGPKFKLAIGLLSPISPQITFFSFFLRKKNVNFAFFPHLQRNPQNIE